MREDFELIDTIILNGKIGYCDTDDENEKTIGIYVSQEVKCLNGKIKETVVDSFPFTKEMSDKCGWSHKYASIQMLTGNEPIDMEHIDETKLVSMEGDVESEYYHRYSDYTGYLWTEEEFKCGGHDIPKILSAHRDEYVYMELKLYRKVE